MDGACGYGLVDQDFIGFCAGGVGSDEGQEWGLGGWGGGVEVCEAFGGEVWDPEDGELVVGVFEGALEVEEGFGAGFDHGVGDEGVVGGGEIALEVGGELEGGLFA